MRPERSDRGATRRQHRCSNDDVSKIWVALPAYNEAPRLPLLIERWTDVLSWLGLDHAIVVVDDGSRDGTAAALAELAPRTPSLVVLTHAVNQGLGATLRDGMAYVAERGRPDDVLVGMDGDNTHPPELFPVMLERLSSAPCDVVIASRFRTGARVEGLSPLRQVLSAGARWMFQAVHRVPHVRDYTCGYRAYRLAIVQQAFAHYGDRFVEREGFDCTADVLLKLAALGARCQEVPLHLDYRAKAGQSHMDVRRTIKRTLGLFLRDVFGRRRGKG